MFLVFSKDKIQTYVVSVLTVVLLIFLANIDKNDVIQTSALEKNLPIYNVQTEEKKIAFTMNCAWNADDIDSILETLRANNVKITFFIVGEWADKYPEEVKKISKEGHEIGTHSNTHPHVNNLSAEKNLEEIKISVNKLEKLTNQKITLYRTPYGEYNDIVIETSRNNGYFPIQWNIDTLDYEALNCEEMWNRIKGKLSNGSIILSHNGTEHTAESLDTIIKNIKKQGYDFVKVSDLIYKENYIINSNGTQVLQDIE